MMRRLVLSVVCCVVALSASSAMAAPITFIHSGTGSGTLDGVAFTDSAFTITAIGDTDNWTSPWSDVSTILHDTATIDIAGLGTLTFVTSTRTFVNNSVEAVGFSLADGADLFDGPQDSVFATWDMLSSIGPVEGFGALMQWDYGVVTDQGTLYFNDNAPYEIADWNIPTTFQAIVDSVPATIPAPGAALLGTLGAGLIGWFRRRGTV